MSALRAFLKPINVPHTDVAVRPMRWSIGTRRLAAAQCEPHLPHVTRPTSVGFNIVSGRVRWRQVGSVTPVTAVVANLNVSRQMMAGCQDDFLVPYHRKSGAMAGGINGPVSLDRRF